LILLVIEVWICWRGWWERCNSCTSICFCPVHHSIFSFFQDFLYITFSYLWSNNSCLFTPRSRFTLIFIWSLNI